MSKPEMSRGRRKQGRRQALTREEAVARTKGTEDAGVQQRWTVHNKQGDDRVTIDGHVVFVAARLWIDARYTARVFLGKRGVAHGELELFDVKPYQANGWTPPKAVLVSGPEATEEYFDFDALAAQATT